MTRRATKANEELLATGSIPGSLRRPRLQFPHGFRNKESGQVIAFPRGELEAWHPARKMIFVWPAGPGRVVVSETSD